MARLKLGLKTDTEALRDAVAKTAVFSHLAITLREASGKLSEMKLGLEKEDATT